jgi:hypothetical protein
LLSHARGYDLPEQGLLLDHVTAFINVYFLTYSLSENDLAPLPAVDIMSTYINNLQLLMKELTSCCGLNENVSNFFQEFLFSNTSFAVPFYRTILHATVILAADIIVEIFRQGIHL